jgi:hypothetical protein
VDVPPKKVPYFKPGKELKELINREAEAEEAASITGNVSGAVAKLKLEVRVKYLRPSFMNFMVAVATRVRDQQKPDEGCVFCDAPRPPNPDSLIVYERKTCYVILNKYPYNNGHVMVVPYRHIRRHSAR